MSDATQMTNLGREQVQQMEVTIGLDFGAPAELFPCRTKNGRGQTKYKRFDTAAEAVRFAVEDVPLPALLGAYLEVDEARFGHREIRYLYESAAYPLQRRGAAL